MKKSIMCLSALLLFFSIANAQSYTKEQEKFLKPEVKQSIKPEDKRFFKPFGKGFVISSTAYWSGVILDSASTGNFQESNPFLRNKRGQLSRGRYYAISGGIYGLTLLIEKSHPKLASILRFVGGGAHTIAAIRNWR